VAPSLQAGGAAFLLVKLPLNLLLIPVLIGIDVYFLSAFAPLNGC
jgi:hypothetical protein